MLRSRPGAVDGIGQPRLHVAQHVAGALAIASDAQRLGRLDEHPQQAGVDVEQLLALRLLPVARGGAAEEPTVDLVVEPAPPDRVERDLDDVRHRRVFGLAIEIEGELEGSRQRKLRRAPEPSMLVVERVEHAGRNVLTGAIPIGTRGALTDPRGGHLLLPRAERLGHALEHRRHAVERDERAAADHVAFRGQKRRRRPPAEAVALADVGAAVGVDADGHEPVVDQARDAWIGVGGAVHVEARLAPRRGDREEHGPALGARTREGGGAPRKPADGVHDHAQL